MLRITNLALAIAVVGIAAAATAAPQEQAIVVTGQKVPAGYEPVSQTVDIRDLNLATEAGVKEMQKRVGHAVAKVCPVPAGNTPSYEQHDYDACQKFAWAGARPQMDRAISRATHGSGQMR